MRKQLGAILATVALSSTALVGVAATVGVTTAAADTVTVGFNCLTTNIPVLGQQASTRQQGMTTTAVSHVYQNDTVNVSITPAPGNEPADLGSGAVMNYVHDLHVYVAVPANSTLLTYGITGGSNLGGGTPTIALSGSRLIVTVPGNITAGTNYQLPTINMSLRASGAALTSIQPRIAGTSFADPGLDFTVNATLPQGLGTQDLPTSCFPSSNPALSTTTIWPIDTQGPEITLTRPADNGSYALNSAVTASYTCDDGPYGRGLATCVGTVPNGNPIDTSTTGSFSFTVTATDVIGNSSSQTVSYLVSDNPGVEVTGGWATEGAGGTVPMTVKLTKPAIQTTTVDYTTENGTAVAGTDYVATSGTITFNPGGSQSQTVNVPVVNNSTYSPPRAFNLRVTGGTNVLLSSPVDEGRIRDDELPAVRVQGGSATEGAGATVPFTVSLEGPPSAPMTVSYATADQSGANHATVSADYQAASGSLSFVPGGAMSQSVSVNANDDTTFEADAEAFDFTATVPANGQVTTSPGVIIDNETHPPVISIGSGTIVEGDQGSRNLQFPVTLDRVVGFPVTVRYSTADVTATAKSDYTPKLNQQLVIEAGKTGKLVTIPVFGDTNGAEGNETFTVTLFNNFAAALGVAQATATILNDDPVAASPAISVSDVSVVEGDTLTFKANVTVSLSVPAPAPVTFKIASVAGPTGPGFATGADYSAFSKNLSFAAGTRTKAVAITIRNDTANEGTETFNVALTNIVGATTGRTTGTVTILDNDNSIPTAPTNLAARTSSSSLGGTEVTWTAATTPLADWPVTGYDYRVSTNGGGTWGSWGPTGSGTSTIFVHNCGQGVSCTYQLRAVNKKGTTEAGTSVTAVGHDDTADPTFSVASPTINGNLDTVSGTVITGDAGFNPGDSNAVTVNVYACAACTNIAPTYSASVTPGGGTWSANPTLGTGVFTVQASQTDWDGRTATSPPVTFQTRNAIFVSPYGNDANPGTALAPKQTITAAATAAGAASRPQIAVAQGTYAPATGATVAANVSVLGGFDQFSGWSRPGSAGLGGTPDRTKTTFTGSPQAVTVSGAVTVTLDALTINGLNTGLGAGGSSYGVRATTASGTGSLTVSNTRVTAAAGIDGTDSTSPGANASGNGCNGIPGTEKSTSTTPSCGGSGVRAGGTGGRGGGEGSFFSSGSDGAAGGNGGGGAAGGSAGGGGYCVTPSPGVGGGGHGGGAGAAGSAGSGGSTSVAAAGATWVGQAGTAGGAGGDGGGGSGGGGGGGTYCAGGAAGGSGGGGGGAGAAGGGSFAVYANNFNVTVTGSALSAAGAGDGGDGANGGNASSAGNGANAFEQDKGGNGAAGAGGGGGGGGGAGGGGAGGPSIALFHIGSGSATATSSTLTRSGASSLGGSPGLGGNGGGGGAGGVDGSTPGVGCALFANYCVNAGEGGASGVAGGSGTPGALGLVCTKYDGGTCTA